MGRASTVIGWSAGGAKSVWSVQSMFSSATVCTRVQKLNIMKAECICVLCIPSDQFPARRKLWFFQHYLDFPKHHCCLKDPRLGPFVFLLRIVLKMMMIMEHWWNDTDRRKPKYSEKSLPLLTLSTTNLTCWPGIESDLLQWEASNPEPWHGFL